MKTNKIIGVLAAASVAMIANAEPFTYQGQLNDNGQSANGLYDISLQIKDAAVGGAVIGSGFTFADVDVVDGLFELEFDPGDIFDSSDVWLEITIDGDGNPVVLSPLTKITATPKAQHATTADIALNAPWAVAPGVIVYGDGNDRVLINRTNTITGAEYFGVHADVNGFVGMYVSGLENSTPFYGYSVDGEVSAYTYHDSASGNWGLWNNGTALTVDEDRDLHVENDVYASSFAFETPKPQVLAISGEVFHSASLNPFRASGGNGGAYITNQSNGWLVAPVNFPNGARITKMTVYCRDTAAGFMSVKLHRSVHGSNTFSSTIARATTEGLSGTSLVVDHYSLSFDSQIDYASESYHIRVYSDRWPGGSELSITSVVFEYTIDEAN